MEGLITVGLVNALVNVATALAVAFTSFQLKQLRKGLEEEIRLARRD